MFCKEEEMLHQYTLEDKKIWVELNKEFIDYEYQEENVWNHPLKSGNLEEDFDNIMRDSMFSTVLFLILEEGVPIGFMNLQSFYSIWSHGKVFLLDDFFIQENFRGKGYGSKALQDLEEYAKENNIKRIQLWAENTNPKAIQFYPKHHYKEQEIHLFVKYMKK